MKNILFFIESLSSGGAEKVLITLLKNINYSKYNVTLLTINDIGPLKKDIDFSKIKYIPVLKNEEYFLRNLIYKIKYKLIYQYLPAYIINKCFVPQKNIDTYIAFTEGFCTKIISHLPKIKKKIAWVHIDLKQFPWTINKNIYKNKDEERKVYLKYNKVITVSKSIEDVMRKEYKLEHVETIYNPIDTTNIIKSSKEINNYHISNCFNIISIGRLVQQKGYDILIPIISQLIKNNLNIHLYILGEGEDEKKLKRIIQEENINNNVHLLGYLENPYPVLKQMDLFVCSSRAEGYSLALAEAITLEIPVISTNCSGPNELIDNNKYGILCNSYDELAIAIKTAVINNDFYNSLKKKVIMRKTFFNIKNTIKQIENIL